MQDDLRRQEAERYLRRLLQSSITLIVLAIVLNVVAALSSHIALWQVLMWLSATSVLVAMLLIMAYIWISREDL